MFSINANKENKNNGLLFKLQTLLTADQWIGSLVLII